MMELAQAHFERFVRAKNLSPGAAAGKYSLQRGSRLAILTSTNDSCATVAMPWLSRS